MFGYFSRLLDTRTLSPHGFCLLWRPELLWTHVVSDLLIFAAYMTIPVALGVIIQRRKDVPFGWMLWCFALFITACGFTHLMAVWTLWHPDYGLEALLKALTAAASLGTAVLLWWLIPLAVGLPSPSQLRAVNAELLHRVAERDLAIAELQHEKAQRLQSEEALAQSRKMDALGQLTGGIAHDFNNLLQAVQGSLELIQRRADDPAKVGELAGRGLEATQRGTRLTAQLLAFARSKQLKVEPFVVSDFILGVRDLLAGSAGNVLDLRFDLDGEDLGVMADRTQLELALLNLVINARDASAPGGKVVVATRRLDLAEPEADLPAGPYVVLSVTDSGAGMSPEVRERAFEPFFSTKGIGQGTGLGLSQVYGVAKQAGGVARIESVEGEGATVSLYLPVTDVTPARSANPKRRRPAVETVGTVLVVDDDANVREIAASALAAAGHTVAQASGGAEALALIAGAVPDLVVLDYAMPGMTGGEAARIIARDHPGLPIIFMTGYAEAEGLESVLSEDAKILRKPFRIDDLSFAVAQALSRKTTVGNNA